MPFGTFRLFAALRSYKTAVTYICIAHKHTCLLTEIPGSQVEWLQDVSRRDPQVTNRRARQWKATRAHSATLLGLLAIPSKGLLPNIHRSQRYSNGFAKRRAVSLLDHQGGRGHTQTCFFDEPQGRNEAAEDKGKWRVN